MNFIKKLKENKLKLIIYFVFLFGLIGVVTLAAWTAPPASPPYQNTPEPLNTGSGTQTKTGDLSLSGMLTSTGGISSAITSSIPAAISGIHTLASKYGIYGQNINGEGWAGYFHGKVETNTSFCISGDCITGWNQVGTWTTDTNGIYYNDTGNVAIGAAPVVGTDRLQITGDAIISGELTVNTIDPVYWIDDVSYATYGHSTTGIKEETMGKIELNNYSNGIYSYLIDFSNLEQGSDLWLFKQIIVLDNEWNDLVVTLTPEGRAEVWYELNPKKNTLNIFSTEDIKVSYRLVAPRFDWPEINTNYSDVKDRNVGLKVR